MITITEEGVLPLQEQIYCKVPKELYDKVLYGVLVQVNNQVMNQVRIQIQQLQFRIDILMNL
jgi:hypothetical protein